MLKTHLTQSLCSKSIRPEIANVFKIAGRLHAQPAMLAATGLGGIESIVEIEVQKRIMIHLCILYAEKTWLDEPNEFCQDCAILAAKAFDTRIAEMRSAMGAGGTQ